MTKRYGNGAALLALALALFASSQASALEVSSAQLLENGTQYEGKEVVYIGEVVGVVMERGEHGWVNVNDGSNAIGVYAPKGLLEKITTTGDYSHKGDIVEVSGVFHRACPEHGGDVDLHAKSLVIVGKGYKIEHPISMSKIFFALLLLIVNLPLMILLNRIKEEAKKKNGQ